MHIAPHEPTRWTERLAFDIALRLEGSGEDVNEILDRHQLNASALLILWACMALLHTLPNENLLANRVGQVLTSSEKGMPWLLLVLLTATLGGLVAGVSALAGAYFKEAFGKRRR